VNARYCNADLKYEIFGGNTSYNKKQQHADRAQILFKTSISKPVINKPVENSMISGYGDTS
jgi:hypothetical protein